jgi:hypothetical protein
MNPDSRKTVKIGDTKASEKMTSVPSNSRADLIGHLKMRG